MAQAVGREEMTKRDDAAKAEAAKTEASKLPEKTDKRKLAALATFTEIELRHALIALARKRLENCTEEEVEAELQRRGLSV